MPMPLDRKPRPVFDDAPAVAVDPALAARVAELNARYKHHSATEVMHGALKDAGKIALVSSFGAESVVLLHMAAIEVSERLGLRNVQIIHAAESELKRLDPDRTLHQFDTDACCDLRKTVPLNNALSGYDGWITGRKRFQSGTRAALDFFEVEAATGRIKINPLAHWAPEDVKNYMEENRLPRHPLVAKGYPSIGCAPCTSPVKPGEDPRAGRWRDQDKDECGIHFVNGKVVRTGAAK